MGKKIHHENSNQKRAAVVILTSDKIDFKIKIVTGDKEGYFVMTKGRYQEDIAIYNIWV